MKKAKDCSTKLFRQYMIISEISPSFHIRRLSFTKLKKHFVLQKTPTLGSQQVKINQSNMTYDELTELFYPHLGISHWNTGK